MHVTAAVADFIGVLAASVAISRVKIQDASVIVEKSQGDHPRNPDLLLQRPSVGQYLPDATLTAELASVKVEISPLSVRVLDLLRIRTLDQFFAPLLESTTALS